MIQAVSGGLREALPDFSQLPSLLCQLVSEKQEILLYLAAQLLLIASVSLHCCLALSATAITAIVLMVHAPSGEPREALPVLSLAPHLL